MTRTLPLLLLAGCGAGWTEARALRPFLDALDRDGDGAVGAEDCADLAWAPPGFPAWDLDGDGRLEEVELAAALRGPDPVAFDAAHLGDLPARPPDPRGRRPVRGPEARAARDVLAFLAAELRAAGYAGGGPDPTDPAGPTSLDTPEAQRALAAYARAFAEAGLRFPGGLLRAPEPAAER